MSEKSKNKSSCFCSVYSYSSAIFFFFFPPKFCLGEFPVTTGRIVQKFWDMTNMDVKLYKTVSNNFSAQFIKIISHYKKIGYNINVLQQTACLVVNPITVGKSSFLFN